jgi:hypothetical protein
MAETKPRGYYHVCYRYNECWGCGDADAVRGEWGAQIVCHACMSGQKPYRPCDGPFCSGDSFHTECPCNG